MAGSECLQASEATSSKGGYQILCMSQSTCTDQTSPPLSRCDNQSCVTGRTAEEVDFPGRKLHCLGGKDRGVGRLAMFQEFARNQEG